MKFPTRRTRSCWAAALLLAISSSPRHVRPAEALIRLSASSADGEGLVITEAEPRQVPRSDGRRFLRTSRRSDTDEAFSHPSANRFLDVEPQQCEEDPNPENTVYDTVDFEIDGTVCGTLEDVANRLETAFLDFFQAEEECGTSDLDVQSVVLVEFTESSSCSEGEDQDGYSGRGLQNTQPSRGRLNRVSSVRRRRALKEGHGTERSYIDDEVDCGPGAVWNEEHKVCAHACDPEGCVNPCTDAAIAEGEFYHPFCQSEYKFVQCDEFHGCFVMPCAPGTKWSQAELTCVQDDAGNRVPTSTTTTTTTTTTSTTTTTTTESACPADLAKALRDAGFEGVEFANITDIQEADCYSPGSQECSSESGVCCGVPGCACNIPSESLCDAAEGCIGQARPFQADFCEEFGWDTEECESCTINRVPDDLPQCDTDPERETTVYDTVEFEIDSSVCGTLEEVASGIEAAFLDFFQAKEECGSSDLDVQSLVLVEFIESELCSEGEGGGSYGGRSLQNTQPSRGRLNRVSSVRRRRSLLEEEVPEKQGMDTPHRYLATCNPEGCANPCTEDAISGGEFYHVYCQSEYKFIQCDEFYGCFVMPCAPGTRWSQAELTCVQDDGDGVTCPADLAAALLDAGFEDVEYAEVTNIVEADCSLGSQQCSSGSGVCCSARGCACSLPSASLCEAEEGCIGQARPFQADFCEDFGWDTDDCEKCSFEIPM